MEELFQDWLEQALQEELTGSALALLAGGMPLEQVAAQTGLTIAQLREMAAAQTAEEEVQ